MIEGDNFEKIRQGEEILRASEARLRQATIDAGWPTTYDDTGNYTRMFPVEEGPPFSVLLQEWRQEQIKERRESADAQARARKALIRRKGVSK
ncbi:MAG: hypothetical protein Q7S88_01810 [Candidatus Daviesbacteria bacterium]|nr:hypothetical protein [Candidatus Daviesbacteria bacterium]